MPDLTERQRMALTYGANLCAEKAARIRAKIRGIEEDGETPGPWLLDEEDAIEYEMDAKLLRELAGLT